MAKFTIELSDNLKEAKQMLGPVEYLMYKAKHDIVLVPILAGLKTVLSRKYKMYSRGGKTVIEEEGTTEEMRQEQNNLEDFMLSDYSKLRKSSYYNEVKKSRTVWRAVQKMEIRLRQKSKKLKEGLIKRALGGRTVLMFFNSIGIRIIWRLSE